jgi:hypothetical protein
VTEEPTPGRRIAIIGTAPTWRAAPWDDPSLEFWCLNDFHVLHPPRADRWFDLHPFDKMHFRAPGQKTVFAGDVPAGFFVRPEGHVEWLKRQTIPVYVQDADDLGSPSAVTFPKAAIEAKFGRHFASSPAWMIGLALLEGVSEIHIYGIHLATEWEYLRQKPNFLFLMGLAAGLGVKLVLPKGCPLLAESHQYAYESDPDLPKVALKRKMARWEQERAFVAKQAKQRRWWQPRDPNHASRLAFLQAQITDAQLGLQHLTAGRPPAGM